MIKGIGIDLCMISRVQHILEREGPDGPFFRRAFTLDEQHEADGKRDRAAFFAARFAVKEAVYKAVAPLTENGFDLRIVESLHRSDGSPYVSITDSLRPYLAEAGVSALHLSVSTEGDFAQAMVIAEGTD